MTEISNYTFDLISFLKDDITSFPLIPLDEVNVNSFVSVIEFEGFLCLGLRYYPLVLNFSNKKK